MLPHDARRLIVGVGVTIAGLGPHEHSPFLVPESAGHRHERSHEPRLDIDDTIALVPALRPADGHVMHLDELSVVVVTVRPALGAAREPL